MERSESFLGDQGRAETPRGREAIPTESALAVQMALIVHMVGESLWESFSPDEQDALVMEWMERYAGDTFNGFAEYCELRADDWDFIDRIASASFTQEDLHLLQKYLEESPNGGVFPVKH